MIKYLNAFLPQFLKVFGCRSTPKYLKSSETKFHLKYFYPQFPRTTYLRKKNNSMRQFFFLISVSILLFSCQGEQKKAKPTARVNDPLAGIDNYVFSKRPFDLVCISRIDTTGGGKRELRQVHLDTEDLQDPAFIIEIETCSYLTKDRHDEFDLPKNTDHAVAGKTINGVDVVLRVFTEKPGLAITERGFKNNDGDWSYSGYKQYQILPNNGHNMTALTIITDNH